MHLVCWWVGEKEILRYSVNGKRSVQFMLLQTIIYWSYQGFCQDFITRKGAKFSWSYIREGKGLMGKYFKVLHQYDLQEEANHGQGGGNALFPPPKNPAYSYKQTNGITMAIYGMNYYIAPNFIREQFSRLSRFGLQLWKLRTWNFLCTPLAIAQSSTNIVCAKCFRSPIHKNVVLPKNWCYTV